MADQQEEFLFKITIDGSERGIKNLADLAKASKDLREERKQLDLTTKEGSERLDEINGLLDRNNDKMKESSSTLEKSRLNVGNYTGALDKLVPGLGATVNGFMGMTKSAMAFIATPIGAILATLATVIGLVSEALKHNDELADKFANVWKGITTVFSEVIKRIGLLGEAVVKVFEGDFSGAMDTAKEAVTGFSDAVAQAYKEGVRFSALANQLADDWNKFNATQAATENRIKQLVLQSKNHATSEAERIALLNQAAKLEEQLTNNRIALVTRESKLTLEQIGQEYGMRIKVNETVQAYGLRLLDNQKIGDDTGKKIAAAIAAIDQAQSSSIALQEKLQNQRDALEASRQAKLEKEAMEKRKANEGLAAVEIQLHTSVQATMTSITAQNEKIREGWHKKRIDTQTTADKKDVQNFDKNEKEKTRIAALEHQVRLANISTAIGMAANLFEQDTIAYKALAIARATMDTYRAAAEALPNFFLAGTIVAVGLADVAKIAGVAFANGGIVPGYAGSGLSGTRIMPHHGIPIRRSNGDNLLATVRTGEVILNERHQQALGGASTFRNIGVPGFADSGISGFNAREAGVNSESISRSSEMSRMLSQMKIYLAIDDFRIGEKRYTDVVDRAAL